MKINPGNNAAGFQGTLAVAKGGTGGTTGQAAQANLGGWYIVAQSAVAVSAPADTNEDVLATITIPAGALGPNGTVRVTSLWTVTNSGNNKVLRVRYSGDAGTAYLQATLTTSASFQSQLSWSNRNAANSQVGGFNSTTPFTGVSGANITSAVDSTAATTIVISGQKASAGEVITLERYIVELAYGA